jgi:heat shock protein HslJ
MACDQPLMDQDSAVQAFLTAGTIAFGPLALTKMMCDDDAMRLEQEVSRVLTGTATYSIEAGSLTLMNGTDGLQFTDSTLLAG